MNSIKNEYKANVDKFCDENITLLPMLVAQAQKNTSVVVRKNKKNKFKTNLRSLLPFILIIILISVLYVINVPHQAKPVITEEDEIVVEDVAIVEDDVIVKDDVVLETTDTTKKVESSTPVFDIPADAQKEVISSYKVNMDYFPVKYPDKEYYEKVGVTKSNDTFKITFVGITGTLLRPVYEFELEILDKALNDFSPLLDIEGRTLDFELHEDEYEKKHYHEYSQRNSKSDDGKYHFTLSGAQAFLINGDPFIVELFSISYLNADNNFVTDSIDFDFTAVSEIAEYFPRISNYFTYNGPCFIYRGIKYEFTYVDITSELSTFSFRYENDPIELEEGNDIAFVQDYMPQGLDWNGFIDSLTMNVDGELYTNINKKTHIVTYYDYNENCYYGSADFPGVDVTKAKQITLEYRGIPISEVTIDNTMDADNEADISDEDINVTASDNNIIETATDNNITGTDSNDNIVETATDNVISQTPVKEQNNVVNYYIKYGLILIAIIIFILLLSLLALYLPMKYTLEKVKNDYYNMYHEHSVGYNSNTFSNRVSSLREIEESNGLFAIEVDAKNIRYSGFDVTNDGLLIQKLPFKEKLFQMCHVEDINNPTLVAGKYHVTLYSGEVIDCYINDMVVDLPIGGHFVLPVGKLNPDGTVDCYSSFMEDKYLDGTIEVNMKAYKRILIVLLYFALFIGKLFNRRK